ncbi:MAG: HAMP domain-containing protein, partial [Magnetococcales bacterium]|nr:HAMP domain-containing protein [Magnetococcales bacterium]
RIQLSDGVWLEFHNHLPEEAFVWPWHLLWSIIILLVVVISLSILAVRLVTRPLGRLAGAARSLGQDLKRPPLTESGSLEVRDVVTAFNAMQARLIQYIQERSAMLAAVSHDLRTPLTRMRLRVEMLKDEKMRVALLRNLDEMEDMTGAAMDYIQGAEGMEEVRLADIPSLLEELQESWQELGEDVSVQCSDLPAFPLMGKSFRRALSNLIQNATKYGKRARIKATMHGERLRISVADDGPGIPEGQMQTVLRPFKRVDNSRNHKMGGTGLGLSIADNIVRAHGGELMLRNRPEGGLEVILTINKAVFLMKNKE